MTTDETAHVRLLWTKVLQLPGGRPDVWKCEECGAYVHEAGRTSHRAAFHPATPVEALAAAARARGLDVTAVDDDSVEVGLTFSTGAWLTPDGDVVHVTLFHPTWSYADGPGADEEEWGSLPTAEALRFAVWLCGTITAREARQEAELDAAPTGDPQ